MLWDPWVRQLMLNASTVNVSTFNLVIFVEAHHSVSDTRLVSLIPHLGWGTSQAMECVTSFSAF